MNKEKSITFLEEVSTQFGDWENLELWIIDTISNEGYTVGEISFVFMNDTDLLDYNRKFLDHDYFTDVITFDYVDFNLINGDILISVDRIIDNAKLLKINYLDEFCRVVIHGVLHLCGFKDKTDKDISLMRNREEFYLERRSFT